MNSKVYRIESYPQSVLLIYLPILGVCHSAGDYQYLLLTLSIYPNFLKQEPSLSAAARDEESKQGSELSDC